MNIVNCSQMRPSWISSIVPRCVLHEWVLHEYRQLFVNASASGILLGPAPCTLHPGCVLHQSCTIPDASASCILHESVPGCISDGCILHWHCCPWLELPWFIVLHVEVIYFSTQPKARKLLRVLYREYYQYAEPQTLLQLYTSLVSPHLEYASPNMKSPLNCRKI